MNTLDAEKVRGKGGSSSPSIAPSLLVRLKLQEPDAWRRLTALYGPVVYGWCRRAGLGAEDAADVGQEVFQQVARRLADFRRDRASDTFRGWLWTIAQNKIRDYFRRAAGKPKATGGTAGLLRLAEIADEVSLSAPSADPRFGTVYRRALELIRSQFEERTWQAFWRVTVEGQTAVDAGKAIGMSAGAVYVAKSRVLRRLRQEFAELLD
jgi:RNA polymerase sigma-70 factor (ECF subfamily)